MTVWSTYIVSDLVSDDHYGPAVGGNITVGALKATEANTVIFVAKHVQIGNTSTTAEAD